MSHDQWQAFQQSALSDLFIINFLIIFYLIDLLFVVPNLQSIHG